MNLDSTSGVIETIDGAGAEETGDGGDKDGGFGDGVIGECGRGDIGDVAEEEAIDGAGGGGEVLDDGGQGGARDCNLVQRKLIHVGG